MCVCVCVCVSYIYICLRIDDTCTFFSQLELDRVKYRHSLPRQRSWCQIYI